MTALRAWLGAPSLGISRWRWLGALLGCVLVALLWRPALAWLSLLPLLGAPRRVPSVDWTPDPAPGALDAHRSAVEADRRLSAEQAESAAREASGAQAAAQDDIATVRERVEARARQARMDAHVEAHGRPFGFIPRKRKP